MGTSTPGNIQPAGVAAAGNVRGRRRSRSRAAYKRDEVIMGYLFVLVPMAIFLTFFLGAMGFDFWISFNHWAILDSPRWIGSANYNYIFRVDPVFWTAIKNTITYCVVVVPV